MITSGELRAILEKANVRHYRLNGFVFSHSTEKSIPNRLGYAILQGKIPLSLAQTINNGNIDNGELQIYPNGSSNTELIDLVTNTDLDQMWFDIMDNNITTNTRFEELFEEAKRIIVPYGDEDHSITLYKTARTLYIQKALNEDRIDKIYLLYYHIHMPLGVRHVINCIKESGVQNQCIWT